MVTAGEGDRGSAGADPGRPPGGEAPAKPKKGPRLSRQRVERIRGELGEERDMARGPALRHRSWRGVAGGRGGGIRTAIGREAGLALFESECQGRREGRALARKGGAAGEIERRQPLGFGGGDGSGDPSRSAELVEERGGRNRFAVLVGARGEEVDRGRRAEELREEEALFVVAFALDRQVGQQVAQPRAQAVGEERIGAHGARKTVACQTGEDDAAKGAAARLGDREQRRAAAHAAERRGAERLQASRNSSAASAAVTSKPARLRDPPRPARRAVREASAGPPRSR